MNRLILVAGVVLAGFFLMQVNSGELDTNQLFTMIYGADEQDIVTPVPEKEVALLNTHVSPTSKKAEDYFEIFIAEKDFFDNAFDKSSPNIPFDSHLYGAILSPDLTQADYLAEFFTRLKQTQTVDTFIIIGKNHYRRGRFNILSTNYGYKTNYGELDPDFDILDELDLPTSYRAFYQEYSISHLTPFIKNAFPNAQIVPIVIKDFANDEELLELVENLNKLSDDETVVLASTAFSQKMTEQTALFHTELSRNAIESFDKSAIAQMDVDSRPAIYVLMNYLEELGAEFSEINEENSSNGDSHIFANFYKGEPDTDRKLTIMAFGDMMLGRYVRTLMDQYGKSYIFDELKGYRNMFFEGADFIFANLEGPIKGQGKKGGTSMNFSFNEDIASFLKKYGFNLFTISNNHALDQGWAGRDSTIEALYEQGLDWCGHPSEADPDSVFYGELGEKQVAFLCFQDVTSRLDDAAAVELIKSVRPDVDYLIVSIHWGYEYKHSPDWNLQISPGRAFIDAGADFIIGHHPHVVQSFEEYNGKFIFYSLGNFVFDQYWSKKTQEELAIGIVLDDSENGIDTTVYLFPMKSELSQSRHMTEDEYSDWIERFISYGDYSEEQKTQIRSGVIEN